MIAIHNSIYYKPSLQTNNLQSILDGTHLSNSVEQKKVAAQADRLSPLLFSLFIADMKYFLQEIDCDVNFYADHMTIGTSPNTLQKALNDLSEYCNNIRTALAVNIAKIKIIKFRRGVRLAEQDHFHCLGKEIDIVNKFCYLVVAVSTKLSTKRIHKTDLFRLCPPVRYAPPSYRARVIT